MASDKLDYYIRELLSNGHIKKIVTRPSKGGMATNVYKTDGPASFITTSTSNLHPENETRLLALNIDESREATAGIMAAIAQKFDGTTANTKTVHTLKDWRRFQKWFSRQGTRVVIPYAKTLSGLIDPSSVRLRRDFEKLLSLVAVHALLHRRTRKVGPHGVIATRGDYRAVWKIMRSVFAISLEASVDPIVRDTVEAVRAMGTATITIDALAKQLRIDKSNATRRFKRAEAEGLLMNRGVGAGRPYAIALAAPIAEDTEVLPTPKVLRRAIRESSTKTRAR